MSIDHPTLDQKLVGSNLEALAEGADLIRLLKQGEYTKGYKPAFQSTIGAHFRHVLEHYQCFTSQAEAGLFCYDNRGRDQQLETDASYALQVIEELQQKLHDLTKLTCAKELSIQDQQASCPVPTSLNRELLFLQSHTVHHYAIIGAMTRAFGNQPEADFGVAIATRVYNKSQSEHASDEETDYTLDRQVKGAACAR